MERPASGIPGLKMQRATTNAMAVAMTVMPPTAGAELWRVGHAGAEGVRSTVVRTGGRAPAAQRVVGYGYARGAGQPGDNGQSSRFLLPALCSARS
jgi:hypothetical protein